MHALKAVPARFDRANQHRRAMIAKVHVAIKQLAVAEDDWRQAVLDISGQTSLKACTDEQLEQLLGWFKSKGFAGLAGKPVANHPVARKARALWISLYHLGAVHNASEQALEAFAARQLKVERLQWANQGHGYKLIEALKAWGEREGWRQTDAQGRPASVALLQIHLCQAIVAKLREAGVIAEDWRIDDAAWKLCGIRYEATGGVFTIQHYERVAKALGEVLRKHGGAHG